MKGQYWLPLIAVGLFLGGTGVSIHYGYLIIYLQWVIVAVSGAVIGALSYMQLSKKLRKPLTERLTRRNLQEDLRASEERLKLVIEGTNDGIWDWDIASGKVFWSDRAQLLAGNGSRGFGDTWELFKSKLMHEDRDKFEDALRGHLVGDVPFSSEVRLSIDNKTKHLLMRGKAKRNEHGKPIRMAGSISDVTLRKTAEQDLIYNAYHDAQTDVGNRRMFTDRLEHLIQRTMKRRDLLFAILLIDIDKFKAINDSFGHTVGDQVLRQISTRLKDCCQAAKIHEPVVARVGGDVFGLVIGDLRSPEQINTLTHAIEQELQIPVRVDHFEINMSATVGIVFNGDHVESSEEMLANADTVLQEAKKLPFEGRCRARTIDSPMRKKAQEIYRMEQELRKAVEHKKFYLVYQPIINIRTNKVQGFEALVRWHKDEGTEVQPSDFIPMAEDTGLILPIGEWILETACLQAKAWVDAGFVDITVAVNFSARQFLNQKLAKLVENVLQTTGLDPKNLKIEITESTAMHEMERTIETLNNLTQMGLQISIDDFGTGYSSLSYLKRYPIDTLKIDRSFVKDIPADLEDMAITRTIIAMANNLHLKIIAEGVETLEQLEFLRREGCEQIQGFYFSRPLAQEAATQFLRNYVAA